MMFRNFANNGTATGFTGMHAGAVASGNGAAVNGFGPNQMMTSLVDGATAAVVPGQGFGAMMNGFTGSDGVDIGTLMSRFWQHLPANGAVPGTPATAATGPGFGAMMGGIAADAGLNPGSMMGAIFHDALNGTTDTSATIPGFGQAMLEVMGNIANNANINLVGMPHMNFDYFS